MLIQMIYISDFFGKKLSKKTKNLILKIEFSGVLLKRCKTNGWFREKPAMTDSTIYYTRMEHNKRIDLSLKKNGV